MLIHCACRDRREDVVSEELLAHVAYYDLRRTGLVRLGDDRVEVLALSNVGDHGDHLASVVFLEPGNDDGSIETSGISKYNFLRHEFSSVFSGPSQYAVYFRQAASA